MADATEKPVLMRRIFSIDDYRTVHPDDMPDALAAGYCTVASDEAIIWAARKTQPQHPAP